MSDYALTTAGVASIDTLPHIQHTFVSGEAITAGAPVYMNTSTGRIYNSDANGSGTRQCLGIASESALTSGVAVTVIMQGFMSGWNFGSATFGSAVFVSDTVGAIADAAGTASIYVGEILPINGTTLGTTADRALFVNPSSGKALSALTALTDNTVGTADATLAAIPTLTDSPASADALRDDIVTNLLPVIRNNFADLAAKVNEIITASA